MAPEPIVAFTELEDIVGEFELPCEYAELFGCDAAANWIMHAKCGCGVSVQRLACGGCKNILLSTENGVRCPAECGEVFVPARHAYHRVEWLRG